MRVRCHDERMLDTPFYFGYTRNGKVTALQAKRLPARVTISKEVLQLAVRNARNSDYPKAFKLHLVKAVCKVHNLGLRDALNIVEGHLGELYPGVI